MFKINYLRYLANTKPQDKKNQRNKGKLNCCSNTYDGEFYFYVQFNKHLR